ncbi:nickel transporter permease [Geosporobacter ferrireducens]|uniref:nickel transporter permease n=1 Tax=Geosporobacter ferrireducens TaxID=1424294 RepID=UPI00139D6768|nr:nickel transporter permease [Geosporobacter ferrireducens]MTI55390.1 ABC transporter permease subunit [Geosporobacter ferrireducens]
MKLNLFFSTLINNKMARICLIGIGLLILIAAFAPVLAPNDPTEVVLTARLKGPSAEFPLGTDNMGRCLLSRLMYGTRISLSVAIVITILSLTIGTIVGMFSGYKGGWIDGWMMRLCDIFLAFPSLVLVLVIIGVLGPGIQNIMIAMIAVHWLWYARVIRSNTLQLRNSDFVAAAKISGSSDMDIIILHIFPNLVPQILVLSTLDLASVIMHLSGFSFLGLGIQPPTPEWGIMISDGRDFIRTMPQLMAYPGMAIFLTVIFFNYLGDCLRDIVEEMRVS